MTRPASKTPARKARAKPAPRRLRPLRWLAWQGVRLASALFLLLTVLVLLFAVLRPPTTHTIWSESRRLGGVERSWVPMEEIAPVAARAVVAAEDANFCRHWGFDLDAIRAAIAAGSSRGASTISQQTVKNVYLWQGRSWVRKAAEAGITLMVEAVWSKRRILEVYLNVAEFGEGIFGIEAAARHYFGVAAADLGPDQAARLAAILPNPKARNAADLPAGLLARVAVIRDGAEVIRSDGRAACFGG